MEPKISEIIKFKNIYQDNIEKKIQSAEFSKSNIQADEFDKESIKLKSSEEEMKIMRESNITSVPMSHHLK
jgi:hypothetical protein